MPLTAPHTTTGSHKGRIHISEALLHSLKTTSIFCLFGALAIVSALFIHEHFKITSIFLDLLEKIGEALIIVGLVDVIIHLPDWNRYFLGNLTRAIMEYDYLARLDDEALKSLIGKVLGVRLKNPDLVLTTKGGFLDFLLSDIQKFVAEPYREGVIEEIICTERDDKFLEIQDTLSYTCRASAAGKIQDEVKWENNPDEIAEMISITISVNSQQGGENRLYTGDQERVARDFPDNMIVRRIDESLKEDGLGVVIRAVYLVRRDVFQYWTMSHLTKNLKLILRYPSTYRVQTAFFGIDEDLAVRTSREDIIAGKPCEITYWRWILPSTGISWKFYRADIT